MPLFKSLSDTAARCCAAALGGAGTAALVTEAYDLCLGALGVDAGGGALVSLVCLDKGDGVAILLLGSDAPLGGTLTVFWVTGASLPFTLELSEVVELFLWGAVSGPSRLLLRSWVPTGRIDVGVEVALPPLLEEGRCAPALI